MLMMGSGNCSLFSQHVLQPCLKRHLLLAVDLVGAVLGAFGWWRQRRRRYGQRQLPRGLRPRLCSQPFGALLMQVLVWAATTPGAATLALASSSAREVR